MPPRFTLPHEVRPYVDPVVERIAGSKLPGSMALEGDS